MKFYTLYSGNINIYPNLKVLNAMRFAAFGGSAPFGRCRSLTLCLAPRLSAGLVRKGGT